MKCYANTLYMIPNCALNFLLQEKEHMDCISKKKKVCSVAESSDWI